MDQFYIVKFRMKDAASITSKYKRAIRRQDDIDHPKFLTDLLGLRVVTIFRSELPKALEMVVKCINEQDGHPYDRSPFIKDSVREIIFYDSEKDGVDPSSIDEHIRNISNLYGVEKYYIRRQSKREYSSIHVTCIAAPKDPYWPLGGPPVEIQIRTVFEDAWCEIDHKYNYRRVRETANNAHDQQLVAVNLPTYRLTQALRTQQDAAVRIADQIYQIGAKLKKVAPSKG